MSVPKEPEVEIKEIPIKNNWWNRDQVAGTRRVSSGPLPTFDELPPLNGSGKATIVEGSEDETNGSPSFPGIPRELPLVQKGVKLDK